VKNLYQRLCAYLHRPGRGPWALPPMPTMTPPEKLHPLLAEWYALPVWVRATAIRVLREQEQDVLQQARMHALRDPAGWPALLRVVTAWGARETLARAISRESVDWHHYTPAAVAVAAGQWSDPMAEKFVPLAAA
jgi:hypothetical protein